MQYAQVVPSSFMCTSKPANTRYLTRQYLLPFYPPTHDIIAGTRQTRYRVARPNVLCYWVWKNGYIRASRKWRENKTIRREKVKYRNRKKKNTRNVWAKSKEHDKWCEEGDEGAELLFTSKYMMVWWYVWMVCIILGNVLLYVSLTLLELTRLVYIYSSI